MFMPHKLKAVECEQSYDPKNETTGDTIKQIDDENCLYMMKRRYGRVIEFLKSLNKRYHTQANNTEAL